MDDSSYKRSSSNRSNNGKGASEITPSSTLKVITSDLSWSGHYLPPIPFTTPIMIAAATMILSNALSRLLPVSVPVIMAVSN